MNDTLFGELLSDRRWSGKIFTGQWTVAQGGACEVLEPATGLSIASVGLGNPSDIAAAASTASALQREWAARPARERAEVLREAAAILRGMPDRSLGWWLAKRAAS